jgi:hypothetical protein
VARKAIYISISLFLALVILAFTGCACTVRKTKPPKVITTTRPVETITLASISSTGIVTAVNIDTGAAITPGDQPADLIATVNYLKAAMHKHYDVPGWIFTRREVFDFKENCDDSVSLTPNHFVEEAWFHLSDEILVFEHVVLMKSMDGGIFQTTIHHDGKLWNSLDNETIDFEPFSMNGFIPEVFDRHLEYATTNPHSIVLTETNGHEAVIISATDSFDQPVSIDCYDKRLKGVVEYDYFDIETGRLLKLESFVIFEDGSEQPFGRVEADIQSGLTPPVEVLQLLSEH